MISSPKGVLGSPFLDSHPFAPGGILGESQLEMLWNLWPTYCHSKYLLHESYTYSMMPWTRQHDLRRQFLELGSGKSTVGFGFPFEQLYANIKKSGFSISHLPSNPPFFGTWEWRNGGLVLWRLKSSTAPHSVAGPVMVVGV